MHKSDIGTQQALIKIANMRAERGLLAKRLAAFALKHCGPHVIRAGTPVKGYLETAVDQVARNAARQCRDRINHLDHEIAWLERRLNLQPMQITAAEKPANFGG